jgi:hypothetical protein
MHQDFYTGIPGSDFSLCFWYADGQCGGALLLLGF